MKGLYLAAFKAEHKKHEITYQDNLDHQGGYNVHQVIEMFIETVESMCLC